MLLHFVSQYTIVHLCLSVFVYVFSIKNDDKMIQAEGVESLSEYELRQACRERGHLGLLSTEEMRQQVCSLLLAHPGLFFIPHPYTYQIPNYICCAQKKICQVGHPIQIGF